MDRQVFREEELPALAPKLARRYFGSEGWSGLENAGEIRRVILTGVAQAHSAAGAILPGFKALSGLERCNAPDIMDFCHFYSPRRILKGCSPEQVLVAVLSFDGEEDRALDALRRGAELGCRTALITNRPDSPCAGLAQAVSPLDLPESWQGTGVGAYVANLTALAALAAHIGLSWGYITGDRWEEAAAALEGYLRDFMDNYLVQVDQFMAQQAEKMKDLTKFEVVGDWNEGYAAQFVEQQLICRSGAFCDHTNSEEFAHIGYFIRSPKSWGMLFLVNGDDPSLSRMRDTLWGCLAQGRPTVVVSDAPASAFENHKKEWDPLRDSIPRPAICPIPTPTERWMSPFVDAIPGALLARHHAELNGKGGEERV